MFVDGKTFMERIKNKQRMEAEQLRIERRQRLIEREKIFELRQEFQRLWDIQISKAWSKKDLQHLQEMWDNVFSVDRQPADVERVVRINIARLRGPRLYAVA